jgi:hypothetical protein
MVVRGIGGQELRESIAHVQSCLLGCTAV